MNEINPDFIEKYQILYQKDPKSKIFAPLAEAYRKMGLLREGYEIAKKGVEFHPYFASGHIALAKILLDQKKQQEAIQHLKKVSELSPENILAFKLLANTWMQLREPREALKAYKMLLFLSPNLPEAVNAVKKLESLEAEDYQEEVFSFKNLFDRKTLPEIIEKKQAEMPKSPKEEQRYIERAISLSDAYIVRNDLEKAKKCLEAAREKIGKQPEIEKRLMIIAEREQEPESITITTPRKKIAFLERLLLRIDRNAILS